MENNPNMTMKSSSSKMGIIFALVVGIILGVIIGNMMSKSKVNTPGQGAQVVNSSITAPTLLTATWNATTHTASFTWTPSNIANGYYSYRLHNNANGAESFSMIGAGTSGTVMNIPNGINYNVSIMGCTSSVNYGNCSPWSNALVLETGPNNSPVATFTSPAMSSTVALNSTTPINMTFTDQEGLASYTLIQGYRKGNSTTYTTLATQALSGTNGTGTFSFHPTKKGQYSLTVIVNDNTGYSNSWSASYLGLTVN